MKPFIVLAALVLMLIGCISIQAAPTLVVENGILIGARGIHVFSNQFDRGFNASQVMPVS